MSNTATIENWKEIVAVLNTLNNKIHALGTPDSLYRQAQLATFVSLREHYLQTLLEMKQRLITSQAA